MKEYGLIGYPLSHSFSKQYFEKKFADENIQDASYKLFPIENIKLIHSVINNNPTLCGLNVTIPYKEKIIPFLNSIDDEAKEIGAVNVIRIERDNNCEHKLKGYNTDVTGFIQSLKPLLKEHHKKALILGTGGASKAVAYALKKLNIDYFFVSRNAAPSFLQYKDLNKEIISSHNIIINTSPVGMFPAVNDYPDIPYQFITDKHLLFDLVYNPLETIFLKKGKLNNAITLNGLPMLHIQAEKAWTIWNEK